MSGARNATIVCVRAVKYANKAARAKSCCPGIYNFTWYTFVMDLLTLSRGGMLQGGQV